MGGQLALKLAGPRVHHKSDVGGLRLDLRGPQDATAAYRELSASVAADGARLLIERMERPGIELLIAARADAIVPALVVGLGGVWAEALDDVAIVPLPADADRLERAIRSLHGAPALAGERGGDPMDLKSAAALAADAGQLLVDEGLDLLELNPVVVHQEGSVVLDALGLRASSTASPHARPPDATGRVPAGPR
jgi:hypothetical protein